MEIKVIFKKIGNHWYADLDHYDPNSIIVEPKLERLFNIVDINNNKEITIEFTELPIIVEGERILEINEEDITRYLMTSDNFELNVWVDHYHFCISSSLYFLLEENFHFDFHNNYYRVNIW